MKVGLLQFSPIWESKSQSIRLLDSLTKNLSRDTDVLILPEMTLTGYTMAAKKYSEEIDGESIKYFMELAKKHKVDVIAGLIEKDDHKFYNSLFHFDSNGLIKAVYRKIHPFSLADEDKHFACGNEIVVSQIDHVNIGLTICYDLRFPELYRLNMKKGAEVLINIANWPIKRINHWTTLLKARAIENQSFMIGINRIGNDPYQTYNGSSEIFSPMGESILKLDDKEEIRYAVLDMQLVKDVRAKLNFLNDTKLI